MAIEWRPDGIGRETSRAIASSSSPWRGLKAHQPIPTSLTSAAWQEKEGALVPSSLTYAMALEEEVVLRHGSTEEDDGGGDAGLERVVAVVVSPRGRRWAWGSLPTPACASPVDWEMWCGTNHRRQIRSKGAQTER